MNIIIYPIPYKNNIILKNISLQIIKYKKLFNSIKICACTFSLAQQ